MAYNIPDTYKDMTPAKQLDSKTLNKMVWRSCFLQSSFNYERMQSVGWLYAILPALEKFHTNKDDLAASMSHNLEFFNTHPFLVNFVMGIVLSFEQNKREIPMIRAVRVSAMGPLGGIGDALFWFTLVPITAGITANMAMNGSIAAPIVFLIVFNAVQFAVRFWLMHFSYKMGTDAIGILTANAKEFTRAASILGIFVVGALTCLYGNVGINVNIPNGTTFTPVENVIQLSADEMGGFEAQLKSTDPQAEVGEPSALPNGDFMVPYTTYVEEDVTIDLQGILDGILPKIIPLIIVMLLYFLMSKYKWTPIKCIVLMLVIGLVGAGFGIWPNIWS